VGLILAHFVFQTDDGKFVSTRKATSPGAYTARVSLSDTLEGARILNTRSAASNAASNGGFTGTPREITLSIKD
jgi:hypothetical protein